jgi:hypothetical protein
MDVSIRDLDRMKMRSRLPNKSRIKAGVRGQGSGSGQGSGEGGSRSLFTVHRSPFTLQ